MNHEPGHQESKEIPELFQIKAPGVDLALKLIQALATNPKTPQNAALLTLLFSQLSEKKYLKILSDWLNSEGESFIDQSPRNQPNQAARVLLVACMAYTRQLIGKPLAFRKHENILDYIKYAADHKWFDEPFLAFFCYHIRNNYEICGTTVDFFYKNYDRYIERRNIAAVAQSLIVLGNNINDIEKGRCYNVLKEGWQSFSTHDLAWCLLGLSTSTASDNERSLGDITHKLIEHLNEDVARFAEILVALDLLTLIDDENFSNDRDTITTTSRVSVELDKENNIFIIRLPVSERPPLSNDLFTFFLVLFATVKTGWGDFTGVYVAQKEDLQTIIRQAKSMKGRKPISNLEMIIANVLTIIATSIIGVGIFLYFSRAKIIFPQIDCSQCDFREIDVWASALIWIGTVSTQMLALFRGKSAISYWLRITPFKQILELMDPIVDRIRGRLR